MGFGEVVHHHICVDLLRPAADYVHSHLDR